MLNPVEAANPPNYTILDSGNPEAQFATDIGQMITSRYIDAEGHVDHRQLRQTLDMVIRYVEDKTGLLPSVVVPPASGNPPSNNPTDPDKWDWSTWEKKYVPKGGIGDMKLLPRNLIRIILGANLEKDLHKISAVLQHSLFKASVKSEFDSATLKYLVGSAKTCGEILDEIFRYYQFKQTFSPTGMIKAAIALGYIPQNEIQQLYDNMSD